MTDIQNAYINALLADATYARDLQGGLSGAALRQVLDVRMTPTLSAYIAGNFSVVSHIESGDFSESGFDATVWKGLPGTPYAGRIYVSMQGTMGLQDFLTDAELALTGDAGQQVIDMMNWWLRITTPQSATVNQYRYARDPVSEEWSFSNYSVSGEGLISAAELVGGTEVNGHSLGGYLASAFTRLFGAQAHVVHTSTFNSAGFAPGSESVFQELEMVLGPGCGLGAFPRPEQQTNYFATNGLNEPPRQSRRPVGLSQTVAA